MSIEIIGIGYGKNVKIGESYLQESVINMWDFPPKEAFVYYSANGSQMIIQEVTKTGDNTYKSRTLSPDEVTIEMKNTLTSKGQKIPTSHL